MKIELNKSGVIGLWIWILGLTILKLSNVLICTWIFILVPLWVTILACMIISAIVEAVWWIQDRTKGVK